MSVYLHPRVPGSGEKTFLSNSRVAFEIPHRIGVYYRGRYYLPPPGWTVIVGQGLTWIQGECGEKER